MLRDLNSRAFTKLSACRASAFDDLDRPALWPPPATRTAIARIWRARVNVHCHVQLDGPAMPRSNE